MFDILIRIQLDRAASYRRERQAERLAGAFDLRSIEIERGSMDRLRLVGDDIAHEADHRRVPIDPKFAMIMKADDLAGQIRQFEPAALEISLDERSAWIDGLLPND